MGSGGGGDMEMKASLQPAAGDDENACSEWHFGLEELSMLAPMVEHLLYVILRELV